ncbi:cysteine hydrolase family protein [Rhizobium sp.]|uniref:cysteine hydrolase family protein n=1 Tax=Rhizobium sp. TaxID=391 RepID=UPI0028B0FCEB
MSKRAIVIVDLQKDYLGSGRFPLVGIDAAVLKATQVVEAARKNGDLVIHIRHESPVEAPFFAIGTEGTDIIPAIAPGEGETVITKNYPNAFRETDLARILNASAVEDVVLVGAMSHMCIDATARASADLGYRTTIVEDACATRAVEFKGEVVPAAIVHAAFMSALAFAYGQVVSTADFASQLKN